MSEINIINIIINVFHYFPLVMALILIIDYEYNHKYDLDIEVNDFEEVFDTNSLLIRIVEKLYKLVNGNE